MPENDPVEAEEVVETHKGFIALDKHQKDVNVQHKRFRDEERSKVAESKRADALQAEIDELKKPVAVVVPSAPDPYSATYAEDVAARDEAIRLQAEQNTANTYAVEQRKKTEEARQASENEVLNNKVAAFDSNMVSHGLNAQEVKAAADTVIGFGISNTFQDILLDDKDGPLFVKYLADNPVEAEQINAMSTMDLVNHLNTDVRPKALLLKPQTSTAPEPPITLTGGGAPETKESWERGAKYE